MRRTYEDLNVLPVSVLERLKQEEKTRISLNEEVRQALIADILQLQRMEDHASFYEKEKEKAV